MSSEDPNHPTSIVGSSENEDEQKGTSGRRASTAKVETTRKKLEKPSRPLNSYNLFFADERKRILDSLPDKQSSPKPKTSHGKIGFTDLARMVSKRWKKIDQHQKAHYEALAQKEKERYYQEMNEWYYQNNKDDEEEEDSPGRDPVQPMINQDAKPPAQTYPPEQTRKNPQESVSQEHSSFVFTPIDFQGSSRVYGQTVLESNSFISQDQSHAAPESRAMQEAIGKAPTHEDLFNHSAASQSYAFSDYYFDAIHDFQTKDDRGGERLAHARVGTNPTTAIERVDSNGSLGFLSSFFQPLGTNGTNTCTTQKQEGNASDEVLHSKTKAESELVHHGDHSTHHGDILQQSAPQETLVGTQAPHPQVENEDFGDDFFFPSSVIGHGKALSSQSENANMNQLASSNLGPDAVQFMLDTFPSKGGSPQASLDSKK